MSGEPTITSTGDAAPPRRPIYSAVKRAFDFCAALGGLILLSPLLLLSAIAVKLDSRGPVFFRQERVGKNFRPFWIFKFRTMVVDAPKLGAQITAGMDPRVTRVGHFLRKSKIDELAQLLNVLLGDMSFVGPRPEVPKYVELFRDDYRYMLLAPVCESFTCFAVLAILRPSRASVAATEAGFKEGLLRENFSLVAQAYGCSFGNGSHSGIRGDQSRRSACDL
jgi:hypothetical protein